MCREFLFEIRLFYKNNADPGSATAGVPVGRGGQRRQDVRSGARKDVYISTIIERKEMHSDCFCWINKFLPKMTAPTGSRVMLAWAGVLAIAEAGGHTKEGPAYLRWSTWRLLRATDAKSLVRRRERMCVMVSQSATKPGWLEVLGFDIRCRLPNTQYR